MSSSPSSPTSIPTSALALGSAGLVPFVFGATALQFSLSLPLIGGPDAVRVALVVYAVAILSFLGGVRWGIALGYDNPAMATRDYAIAVVPALVGWAAALMAPPADLWVLAVAFLLLGLMDYGLTCRTVAPEWYGNLRLGLTAVVTLALVVAALA